MPRDALRRKFLPFFSEIIETEMCGRLIFSFLSDAYKNKHHNSYDVGEHFNKLFCTTGKAGNIDADDVKSAKQEGT